MHYCLFITYTYGKEWIEKAAKNTPAESEPGLLEIKYNSLEEMKVAVIAISSLSINGIVLVPCRVEDNCWEVIAL